MNCRCEDTQQEAATTTENRHTHSMTPVADGFNIRGAETHGVSVPGIQSILNI